MSETTLVLCKHVRVLRDHVVEGELCCCADKHVSTPALNDRVRVLRDHVVDVVDELDRILWELDNGYSG